jgi:hypothetical protein
MQGYAYKKKKKKKRGRCHGTFFEIFLRFFGLMSDLENVFVMFLGSSCLMQETAKIAIKKKIEGKDDRKQEKVFCFSTFLARSF